MAVEEVVLSVPGHSAGADASDGSPVDEPATLERVVREYFDSARARDRVAFGNWMRKRRHERYELALKTLVKTMATEASRTVSDRVARLAVRTQVYGSVMVLARAMARDHLVVVARVRRTLRWGLGLGLLGALGVVYTVIANDWFVFEWLQRLLSSTRP